MQEYTLATVLLPVLTDATHTNQTESESTPHPSSQSSRAYTPRSKSTKPEKLAIRATRHASSMSDRQWFKPPGKVPASEPRIRESGRALRVGIGGGYKGARRAGWEFGQGRWLLLVFFSRFECESSVWYVERGAWTRFSEQLLSCRSVWYVPGYLQSTTLR